MLIYLRKNGFLYDPDTVELADPEEMFGLRAIDGEIVADSGTALTRVSTGIYEYSFTEEDVEYEYYVKYTETVEDVETIIHEYHTFRGSVTLPTLDALATMEDAITYLDQIIDPTPWNDASSSERIRALNVASKMIRQLPYNDITDGKEEAQKFAVIELAISILNGVDLEEEYNSASLIQASMGNTKFVTSGVAQEHLVYGIPNLVSWRYLKPYIIDPRSIRCERVS